MADERVQVFRIEEKSLRMLRAAVVQFLKFCMLTACIVLSTAPCLYDSWTCAVIRLERCRRFKYKSSEFVH